MEARLGSDVDFRALGSERANSLNGYLAIPPHGSGPGVVVLHEAWGLADEIRDSCDRLAREGFVALAPDLYRGENTRDHAQALAMMSDLELDSAVEDVDACVSALLGHESVTGSRVASLGFCMGGQLALLAATRLSRIGAVVDCYGVHPKVEFDFDGLEASVLGIFAENDDWIPAEAVQQLESDLKAAGKRVSIRVHLGVQHAFMNPARPDVYDAATSAEAWNELLAFLRAELQ